MSIEWLRLKIKYLQLQIAIIMLQDKQLDKTRREQLFEQAQSFIGKDASPSDMVHDDLGCAESVTAILQTVIDFPIITGTWTLNDRLAKDSRFRAVTNYQKGDIIISPTGTGNGNIRGHVGICAKGDGIMSNTSTDGIWRENYTQKGWRDRYKVHGGMPINYYRLT